MGIIPADLDHRSGRRGDFRFDRAKGLVEHTADCRRADSDHRFDGVAFDRRRLPGKAFTPGGCLHRQVRRDAGEVISLLEAACCLFAQCQSAGRRPDVYTIRLLVAIRAYPGGIHGAVSGAARA